MSRRKQQNPKPLVALKQAEDEADKPSGCETGSMTQGELLEDEVTGVERDGDLSLGQRTEPFCYGSGSGGHHDDDDAPGVPESPLTTADVREAESEADTTVVHDADTQTGSQASSVRSFSASGRLSSAVDGMAAAEEEEEEAAQPARAAEADAPSQEIIKVVRLDDGEYRVLSRAYVAAGSGCGPFPARYVPTGLADELCRQQPAIAEGLEARLLKFCQGDVVHWYLLEADDGRWLRFLDAPTRCRQPANVAIHYVGNTLWLEVTQPLEPNDRLVAELIADSGGSCHAAAAVAAGPAASPRRSVADDCLHDGLRSEETARALRATPAAVSAAVRLSLDAQADDDDSTATSDGRSEQKRQDPDDDRERDAHSRDGLALSSAAQHSDSGGVAADSSSRVKQFGTALASLSCRTCGVTFRSQRTLEAHQLYYCNQTASGVGAAAATAAPPSVIAASSSGSPARVTSACSARSGGSSSSLPDVKSHLPTTLLQHVSAVRDLQPDGDRDSCTSSVIGAFQCQMCPHQTTNWQEMRAHVRDHAHIMHQVPLSAALRCIDSDASVAEAAVVAAAAFRRPDKRPSSLLSADSYCANCDIQFMSAASYDAHRQHYCGSRRGRLPAPVDGRNDGAATEASTTASQPSPLPVSQLSAQASEQATLLLSLSRSSSFRYLPSAVTTAASTTVAATAAGYDAGAAGANATPDKATAAAATGHSARAKVVADFTATRTAVAPGLPTKVSKGSPPLSVYSVPSPMSRTDAAGDRDVLLLSPATTAAAVVRSSVDSCSGGTGHRGGGRSPLLQVAAAAAATPPLLQQRSLTSHSFRTTTNGEEGADDGDGSGSGSRRAEPASSLTISIPAVLSVPAPLVDGSIVCGDRGSLPGRLIIGALRSPASAAGASDAADVTSLPLEVPAGIIQRAMAASQQPIPLLRSTTRQGSAASAVTSATTVPTTRMRGDTLSPEVSQSGQPAPPVSGQCRLGSGGRSRSGGGGSSSSGGGKEAPLDLSMKCLKRKLPLAAADADGDLSGERVPSKILAAAAYDPISVSVAAAATAAAPAVAAAVLAGSSLTPVRAPAGGGRGILSSVPHAMQVPTAAALLSKCVDCNILFYKHENYVAHKTHYCPARHRELSQVVSAAASRPDRAACWSDAGCGSNSSSSSSSNMAEKYTAVPPTAAVATTAASSAGRTQPSVATAPDSVEEAATMATVGQSHAANAAALGEAALAAEQRPAAASPTAPASDDVSRDGSVAEEQPLSAVALAADDRLVITYTCNKCGRSFTALDHFGKHACSAATGSTAPGAAAALGASLPLLTPNARPSDADASPRVASSRPCYGSAVADVAAAGESTSALIGALRRCGANAAAAPSGSGSAVTTASGSAFVCSLCGYHGNTVRGMRLHGRYHIDRGEPWSEACIMDNGQRAGCGGGASSATPTSHLSSAAAAAGVLSCGTSAPLAGLLHLQQQSPYIEEELLRLKNEPYKKRKSRKSYQLFCAATAAAAATTASGRSDTATPPAAFSLSGGCSDSENASTTTSAVTPVSALDVATLAKFLAAARTGGIGSRLGFPDESGCPLPQSASSSAEQPSPKGCSTRLAAAIAPALGNGTDADDALATGSPPATGERSRTSASRQSPAAVSPLPLKPLNGTVQQLANAHDSSATTIPAANVAALSDETKLALARALTPSTASDAGTPAAPTKVKAEPMADDVSPDALSAVGVVSGNNDGNSENRRSLSTPRRHVCSHCNIGFMYPTSFDAHVKFYCPSSRTASGVTATGN